MFFPLSYKFSFSVKHTSEKKRFIFIPKKTVYSEEGWCTVDYSPTDV